MAKISEYTNYGENVPSGGSTAKFKETGVIPVSGKYTDNGAMETRNVPLSEVTVEQVQALSDIFLPPLKKSEPPEWEAPKELSQEILLLENSNILENILTDKVSIYILKCQRYNTVCSNRQS